MNPTSVYSRFGQFFSERFPLIPNILIAAGLTLTSFSFFSTPWKSNLPTTGFVFIVFFLFLLELRLMDELKDLDKDKIAHPERPLPRGLISVKELNWLVTVTQIILFLLSFISFFIFVKLSAIFLLMGISWLYLMYKEFFCGEKLGQYPFLYAISHQVIIIPMGLFAILGAAQIDVFNSHALLLTLLLLATFFTYEISRKLDPLASPILKTYLVTSGKIKTLLAIFLLAIFSFWCGSELQLGNLFFIPLFLTLFSHLIVIVAPSKFKITEGIVTLYLLFIIWLIPLKNILN